MERGLPYATRSRRIVPVMGTVHGCRAESARFDTWVLAPREP
jgi:hypothetical protein